jgi:hypothetical protein
MQTYMVFMPKNNFDASKASIGSLVYIYNSENLNRTLGFVTMQHEVRWIPLAKDESQDSGETEENSETESGIAEKNDVENTQETETNEMKVTDNGN